MNELYLFESTPLVRRIWGSRLFRHSAWPILHVTCYAWIALPFMMEPWERGRGWYSTSTPIPCSEFAFLHSIVGVFSYDIDTLLVTSHLLLLTIMYGWA